MGSYSRVTAFYSDRNHIPWAECVTELACAEITDHGGNLLIPEGKKFQGQ